MNACIQHLYIHTDTTIWELIDETTNKTRYFYRGIDTFDECASEYDLFYQIGLIAKALSGVEVFSIQDINPNENASTHTTYYHAQNNAWFTRKSYETISKKAAHEAIRQRKPSELTPTQKGMKYFATFAGLAGTAKR